MPYFTKTVSLPRGNVARGEAVENEFLAVESGLGLAEADIGKTLRFSTAIAAATADAAARANKTIVFDASGDPLVTATTEVPSAGGTVSGNLTVDGTLTVGGTVFLSGEIDLENSSVITTYVNGWQDYDTSTFQPRFYKDKFGMVRLTGLVKSGIVGSIFVLPAGYGSVRRESFAVVTNAGLGRIDVSGTDVRLQSDYDGGAATFLSLAGVAFRTQA